MTQEVKLRRVGCNYRAENARFLLECDFSRQYHCYYRKRLELSRPYLEYNCRYKWPISIPIYNLTQLSECDMTEAPRGSGHEHQVGNDSQSCIIIGTIFKRMKLQPDVLEELSHGNFHVSCERYSNHYISQDDRLIIEDDGESIAVTGNINAGDFVTGVVVALLGRPIDDCSKFFVFDICYAEPNMLILESETILSDQRNRNFDRKSNVEINESIYLMVLSGLEFQHNMDKDSHITKALQNIINFVWGGEDYAENEYSSRVARILVIGNNLFEDRLNHVEGEKSSQDSIEDDIATKIKRSRQLKPYVSSIKATKHMDDFFAELSKTINVDVMPGPSDPTSHLMPQQPFHPCMFPKSSMFSTFNCVTNPHRAIYHDNIDVLATSGQNIDIIDRFSSISDPIEIMKHHLLWGNMAPSAPDNLYSAPYEDDDPMVIDFIPSIYLAGCQEYYRTDYHYYNSSEPSPQADQDAPSNDELKLNISKKSSYEASSTMKNEKKCTLLITVPKFSETMSCVLINLKNLESQLVSFR